MIFYSPYVVPRRGLASVTLVPEKCMLELGRESLLHSRRLFDEFMVLVDDSVQPDAFGGRSYILFEG